MANPNSKNWTKYDELFAKYGYEYGVNPHWLKAIAIVESDLGEDERVKNGETSGDGLSWGLMQLTLPTASDMLGRIATESDLNNALISIKCAAKYLHRLAALFQGDQEKIVMSYNQGQGNTLKGRVTEGAKNYYEKWLKALDLVQKCAG